MIIQNAILSATIHAPSGKTLSIGGDKVHAFVIDRSRFDAEFITQAQKNGAELFVESKLTKAISTANGIAVQMEQLTKSSELTCDLLIGADGARSLVRDAFQFPPPQESLNGMGADITDVSLDPTRVEIFLGNEIAPGFFAWIIPTNKNSTTARVGVCITKHAQHPLKQYFTSLFTNPVSAQFLQNAHITTHHAGSIPLGPLKKTTAAHVMLVGDAAAQVKPSSGGGLYPGLFCAKFCSSVAIDALRKKEFTMQILKQYHTLWNIGIGRELRVGMRFRSIYTRLNDNQLNSVLGKFNNPKTIEAINTYGDIDYPSKLVFPVFKTAPSLLRFLPLLTKSANL